MLARRPLGQHLIHLAELSAPLHALQRRRCLGPVRRLAVHLGVRIVEFQIVDDWRVFQALERWPEEVRRAVEIGRLGPRVDACQPKIGLRGDEIFASGQGVQLAFGALLLALEKTARDVELCVPDKLGRLPLLVGLRAFQVAGEISLRQFVFLEDKAGDAQPVLALGGLAAGHPRQRRREGRLRLLGLPKRGVALRLEVSRAGLPSRVRLGGRDLFEHRRRLRELGRFVESKAALIKPAPRLVGSRRVREQLLRPLDHLVPLRLAKRHVANRRQRRGLELRVRQLLPAFAEQLPRILRLPRVQQALPLQDDDALPLDLRGEIRLRQQRREMRQRLFVLLQRIKTQPQPPPRHVRFRMGRVLREKGLELRNRHREEVAIVSRVPHVILLQRRILLRAGRRAKGQQRRQQKRPTPLRGFEKGIGCGQRGWHHGFRGASRKNQPRRGMLEVYFILR